MVPVFTAGPSKTTSMLVELIQQAPDAQHFQSYSNPPTKHDPAEQSLSLFQRNRKFQPGVIVGTHDVGETCRKSGNGCGGATVFFILR